jgi:hypothetical protein
VSNSCLLFILFINLNHYLTATTTTHPCGIPVSAGSSGSLFSTSVSISLYTCIYYQWVSPTNGTVTLAFQMENDPDLWYLDDVSVSNGTAEMLLNGGFESVLSHPVGQQLNQMETISDSVAAGIASASCHTGSYCVKDGCNSRADQVSQHFVAIAGESYFISFWLKAGSGSGIITFSVTLS